MRTKDAIAVIVVSCIILFCLIIGNGISYDTTTITATVNITHSNPIIMSLNVYPSTTLNLSEGTYLKVACNATIRDYNGNADIKFVNASFYQTGNTTLAGASDNNNMYRNTSCFVNDTIDGITATYSCTFNVYYYANNGTWNCSLFVASLSNHESNRSVNATINSMYAINVTDRINYGNLSVYDTSAIQEVNITNFGNKDLNLTIYGYGGNNFASGQNLAMVCPVGDNITIDNERFALNMSNWTDMKSLTSSASLVSNLTVTQQTEDNNPVINSTYWALYVPPNPFGECNGTVVFEAIAP